MKTCLIPPVRDLVRFIGPEETHHLVLAHILDLYPEYEQFYLDRANKGDYIILDNGAKENGSGVALQALLHYAQRIEASEIVLTDVRYEAEKTLEAAKEQLAWLMTTVGTLSYASAGQPRIMVVPQGRTEEEWADCYNDLILMTNGVLDIVAPGHQSPVIGVAYHYDHMFQRGLEYLIQTVNNAYPIHLLGWPRRLLSLYEIAQNFPKITIRSVDSSRPFSYAIRRQTLGAEMPYPGERPENYFDQHVPSKYQAYAEYNIKLFKQFAEGRL